MAYLRNNTVNLLNLHYGIFTLAQNAGMGFFLVFLLKSGVSTPMVLAAMAFVLAGRFLLRPLVLLLAIRWGLRTIVVIGTVAMALPYPFLAKVHGIDAMLLGFCIATIVADTFYWTSYHAYFASMGDADHRGHQIGAREALVSVASVVGPLLGGWSISALGPEIAFGIAAVIQLLAVIPLLGTPNVKVPVTAAHAFRAAAPSIVLFAADGWISSGWAFVWQIALFLSLGESFPSYGGAMALAALAGAAASLILGRHIDAGRGGRAMWIAFAALAGSTLFRAFSIGSATLAVAANASAALVTCLYIPILMTAIYNESKKSPCAMRFHVATEGGWDVGAASGCLIAAAVIAAGAPLSAAILLSLGGMAVSATLLRRYYKGERLIPGFSTARLNNVLEPP